MVKVRIELPAPFPVNVTETGLRSPNGPPETSGETETLRATVTKPFKLLEILTEDPAEAPWTIVIDLGLEEREKSDKGGNTRTGMITT